MVDCFILFNKIVFSYFLREIFSDEQPYSPVEQAQITPECYSAI